MELLMQTAVLPHYFTFQDGETRPFAKENNGIDLETAVSFLEGAIFPGRNGRFASLLSK